MVLQFDLAGGEDGLVAVPVILQRDVVDHHFTVKEHLDFVAHLKQDLDVLNEFSDACRKHGWR